MFINIFQCQVRLPEAKSSTAFPWGSLSRCVQDVLHTNELKDTHGLDLLKSMF